MIKKNISLLLIFSSFIFLISPFSGFAASANMDKIAEEAMPAVVMINGYTDTPSYIISFRNDGVHFIKESADTRVVAGSGFFVTSNGYILTNNHVINDDSLNYKVDTGQEELDAKIIYADPDDDLAVLKISGENYPYIKFASAGDISRGDSVVSIGNALGRYVDSIATGKVISLNKSLKIKDEGISENLKNLIVANAKLYPGDSGGPLLNSEGKVVGVNVATATSPTSRLSFFIPISLTQNVLEKAGVNLS